jgi:hypothetical protein
VPRVIVRVAIRALNTPVSAQAPDNPGTASDDTPSDCPQVSSSFSRSTPLSSVRRSSSTPAFHADGSTVTPMPL